MRVETTIDGNSDRVYISDRNLLTIIQDNCKSILEKANYTCGIDEKTYEVYVYAENNVAIAVAEIYEDIADSTIEYRRHDMKGDLRRKGEVLCTLFKKLESVATWILYWVAFGTFCQLNTKLVSSLMDLSAGNPNVGGV